MMNIKVYPTTFYLLFLSFFAVVEVANAQKFSSKTKIIKKHYLYFNEVNQMGCTNDLRVIETAKLRRKNNPIPLESTTKRNPQINLNDNQGLAAATFIVTYDAGFNANPAAKAAFQKAVDTWATLINSPIPIRILATFEVLDPGILGSTYTNEYVYEPTSAQASIYPSAIVKFFENAEVFPIADYDMEIAFNSAEPTFSFNLNGSVAGNKIDFVSTVLHEIGHGLGFGGSGRADDADLPCDNSSKGCIGYQIGGTIYPNIYDRYVQNTAGTSILTLPNPSLAIRNLILSNNLYFDSPVIKRVNGGLRANLYAPATEEPGSSYSHFDEDVYNNTANALMTPYLNTGELQRNLGSMGCALLKTIGWNMSGACAAALPIELSNFQAANKGNRNTLTWTTLTELNNKMFKIERSFDGKTFTEIGEVKGAGTTEFPRSYTFYDEGPLSISYYRLRQIDFDGKSKPSNIVSVSRKSNNDIVIFPNPTKDKLTFSTTSFEPNRVVVYNNLGQIVMDKNYQINELDVSSLPVGVYVIELNADDRKVNKRFVKH